VGLFFSLAAPAIQQQTDEPISLRAELVVLDAQVVSKKTSQAVGSLTPRDFILYEDGVKQHISHFSQDKLPLSVLILFDVSGSVWPDRESFERMRRGALEALKQLKPEDEVALMQFAQHAKLIQGFTRDREAITDAFSALDGRREFGTLVNEGIYNAAAYLRNAANPDSRRVIISITDDVTSVIPDRTLKDIGTLHSGGETLRALLEGGIVVCGLLYGESFRPPAEPLTTEKYKSSTSPAVSSSLSSGLVESHARNTGGIAFRTSHEGIAAKLGELVERLRSRYSIGYTPSNPKHDGKFRKIKLAVTAKVEKAEGGVAVITRKGYYSR
jgi:VWFA-related protein